MRATEVLKLSPTLIERNVRWLMVPRNKLTHKVLDFKMHLDPMPWRLDIKEDSIMKQLYLDSEREPLATRFMRSFIRPHESILELGANIGYYVLLERSIAPSCKIYAVEPDPKNFAMLKENLELNAISDIECFCMAMADKEGTYKLYLDAASNYHTLIPRDGPSIDVPTTTVDAFVKGRKISFLRMDIEGYETEVIKGMSGALASKSLRRLFVEIHPHLVPYAKMRRFLVTLQRHGFDVAAAISRDNVLRAKLGHAKLEKMPIGKLINDNRIKQQQHAFELFF